jgi:hypothetical protein
MTDEASIKGVMTTFVRETYSYDVRGNPVSRLTEMRDTLTNSLQPHDRETYLYDRHGNILLDQGELIGTGTTGAGSRITYVRDDDGNVLLYLYENWDKGWTPAIRVTTTRDDHGRPLSEVREVRSRGRWIGTEKAEWTYDTTGNLRTETRDFWVNGQWQTWSRETWSYDEQKRVLEHLFAWGSDGRLHNGSRTTHTYEGDKEQSYLWEEWQDNAWAARTRVTFDYDANGDRVASTVLIPEKGVWSIERRMTSHYDASRRLTAEFEDFFRNGQWSGAVRGIRTYSDAGALTLSSYETVDSLGVTIYGSRFATVYDDRGIPSRMTHDRWQDGGWQPADYPWAFNDSSTTVARYPFTYSPYHEYYFSGYRIEMKSSTIGSVIPAPATITLLQNFPNPFNPKSAIRFQISSSNNVTLTVYDLLGREVAVLVNRNLGPGAYDAEFNASGLPSGAYFYRLQAGSLTATKKMLLLR